MNYLLNVYSIGSVEDVVQQKPRLLNIVIVKRSKIWSLFWTGSFWSTAFLIKPHFFKVHLFLTDHFQKVKKKKKKPNYTKQTHNPINVSQTWQFVNEWITKGLFGLYWGCIHFLFLFSILNSCTYFLFSSIFLFGIIFYFVFPFMTTTNKQRERERERERPMTVRSIDFIFLQKCHCIHFQENENTKKLYSFFIFKNFFLY